MTMAPTRLAMQDAMASSARCTGRARITMSTGSGASSSRAKQGRPWIVLCEGFTGKMRPA